MDVTIVTKQLRQNPFEVYRDPLTGKWVVIKNQKVTSDRILNSPKGLLKESKSAGICSIYEVPAPSGEHPLGE